ncbi:jacalin-related lectin 19-like [Cornus florida]|uniref:jacalin-related lectin 19-like n=1 Tax=Cornus florida TaxID=4283 RepID=UPI00289775CA|nr:jacalin-related lectin 19-like [Cornus florida]
MVLVWIPLEYTLSHSTKIDSTTPLGPFGGAGGQQWDDETYNTVRELTIYSGYDINFIQVVNDDIEGKPVSRKKHGGDSGQPNTVKLDYPIEYLLSISGHYGYNDNNTLVLRSLTLQSNIKQYGPYGTENGTHFITPLAAGKIVGFFGRDGARLDSIRAYIKPFQISVGPFGTTRGQ